MKTHRMRSGLAVGLCAMAAGMSAARAATTLDFSTTTAGNWKVTGGGATGATPVLVNGNQLALTSNGMSSGTPITGFNPASFDGFWTASYSFDLPAGATGATLDFNGLFADDRAVLFLNGTQVGDTGTTGPGAGTMVLSSGGTETPFTFDDRTSGTITTGFLAGGTNTLTAVINNTTGGTAGTLAPLTATNGSSFAVTGSVSFTPAASGGSGTPAAVPLPPAAWTGLATVLGLTAVQTLRRRRVSP